MNRRQFLLAAAATAMAPAQARRPPNFILIFADDLGYGDIGPYGSKTETPNLSRMAKEGALFTDFYVPMPFCAPSRSTLLTGRYPFRTGVTNNPAPDAEIHDVALPLSEITIAEALKPLGYATCAIGKWHLGHLPKFLPRTQGFDEYYGILYSNDMRPVQIVKDEEVAQYPVVQAHLTRDYTQRAIDFIDRNRNKPFFLYLPHAMPHKPLAASEDFYTPETREDLYADVIRELDWSVGQILKGLADRGLDDKTMVVFTSDNGAWHGGSTGGLRGMKGSSWEGGVRVPMIARWPGQIPGGVVQKGIAATIDIFPTFCKLAGAKIPQDRTIDGLDILPMMKDADTATPHEAIFAMQGQFLAMVRSGKWKLHVRTPSPQQRMTAEQGAKWVDPRGPDGVTMIAQHEQADPSMHPGVTTGDPGKEMMLFDLEADRAEQHDVAARHPEIVAKLKTLYDKMNADVPKPKPAPGGGPRKIQRPKGGNLSYEPRP